MHQLLSYIKFLLNSTNQHGVHSPFVYDFVTKCLYNKTNYKAYTNLKTYRNQLLQSKEILNITDFGAGSKILNSKKRSVSKMVKNSSSPLKDSKLLFRISNYFKFKNTLELGTSLGVGTQALALGHSNNNITTIEGCPETFEFSRQQFEALNLSNITTINSDFKTAISQLKEDTFDCIFFDGHHNRAATLDYFNLLISKAHNNSVFIFDDIYWSKGMTEAWREITTDKQVTVSIDTFNFGFVFFRKEQPKQHFTIRL
ncbi:methyltransferase family protein [Winogradskyella wandonensis]|uniref:Methyltransferase family protein n=1 Tax=Winogradskyella wandonensis TaxID=1442586 RepID=A0A4R1KVS3_9FLAO|nr:class I SAM-dependent methyltransferase [Winogradskyella wandonensis]TCK68803.1 methyltransferase family protein [Winogradskyella wandonensis]